MPFHPMSVNANTRARWDAMCGFPELRDVAGRRVLDVGCGLGFFSVRLAARGACVTGADLDEAALKHLSARFAVPTVRLDAERDPWPGDGYDLVLVGEILEHVADPAGLVRKGRDALAPGGHMVLSTPALEGWLALSRGKQLGHDHGPQKHEREGFFRHELMDLLAAAGLEPIRHRYCVHTPAELFMQLTKLGYLSSGKRYDGQSDVLALVERLPFRIFRLIFPAVWAVLRLGERLGGRLDRTGHCHLLVARRPVTDSLP